MAQFPTVAVEEGLAFPNATAGSGSTQMAIALRGLFTMGTPPDLARVLATTGGLTITLVPGTVFGLYIRNVGVNPVQVTWTPTAGASAVIQDLAPGAFIAFAQPANAAAVVTATPGITALTLTALTASTPCEVAAIG
jgi:hypothetical protein